MEANETEKVNKANFLIFMHHEYGAREWNLLKWLFLMSGKDMNEKVLNNSERCGLPFLRLYLLLRLFCNLVLHFLPETRQATSATTYNTI